MSSSTHWLSKDWMEFNELLHEEGTGLFINRQEAERKLRKLCASGAIQTVRFIYDEANNIKPEFISPNEWKRPDFDTTLVYLSPKDLSRQWLELQNTSIPEAGKQPRIRAHLAKMFPNGVPNHSFCPRKALKADLLKRDPGLNPLDEATLKSAIEAYNASLGG
jgi:hypothetical protein